MCENKKIEGMTLEEKVNKVLELGASTPDGQIQDADTLLADIIEQADYEVTGLFESIAKTWLKSKDRKGIEGMFYNLMDYEFEDFLDLCIKKTTEGDSK